MKRLKRWTTLEYLTAAAAAVGLMAAESWRKNPPDKPALAATIADGRLTSAYRQVTRGLDRVATIQWPQASANEREDAIMATHEELGQKCGVKPQRPMVVLYAAQRLTNASASKT